MIEQCKEDPVRNIQAGNFGHDQLPPPSQLPSAPQRACADGQVVHETTERYLQRLRRYKQQGYVTHKSLHPWPPSLNTAVEERQKKPGKIRDCVDAAVKECKKKNKEAEGASGKGEVWEEGWEVNAGVGKTTIVKRSVVDEMSITQKVGKPGWDFNRRWEEKTWTVAFGEEGMKVVSSKRTGREEI